MDENATNETKPEGDLWSAKMKSKRAELVLEQGKAVRMLQGAEQQVEDLKALLQRIAGAIMVIDELMKTEGK